MFRRFLVSASMIIMTSAAFAADKDARGTQAEAKAMLERAVAYYQANGRTKALAEFSRKRPPFSDRDLYVFCIGPGGKLVANGAYREYLNLSADILKDADGRPLGSRAWDIAIKNGKGELHYNWLNPVTKLIEPKVSYLARVGQDVCGVGSYDRK